MLQVQATREGGLRELRGFLNRSQYLRGDGKNEYMISFSLEPTGRPDEFQAEFVVPAVSSSDPNLVLPEGPIAFI